MLATGLEGIRYKVAGRGSRNPWWHHRHGSVSDHGEESRGQTFTDGVKLTFTYWRVYREWQVIIWYLTLMTRISMQTIHMNCNRLQTKVERMLALNMLKLNIQHFLIILCAILILRQVEREHLQRICKAKLEHTIHKRWACIVTFQAWELFSIDLSAKKSLSRKNHNAIVAVMNYLPFLPGSICPSLA